MAITQSFIDGLRDAALPAALSCLENAKFNVSQLHGTIPGGKWWVTKIQQSNVGADAAVMLLAPNKVGIQLTNLKLNLYAGACGQELFLKACGSLTGEAAVAMLLHRPVSFSEGGTAAQLVATNELSSDPSSAGGGSCDAAGAASSRKSLSSSMGSSSSSDRGSSAVAKSAIFGWRAGRLLARSARGGRLR